MQLLARKISSSNSFANIRGGACAIVADSVQNLTVIIPTLNERVSIEQLLGSLHGFYPRAKVIIVDDGSKDGTIEFVRSFQNTLEEGSDFVRLIDRTHSRVKGLSASVLEGIRNCASKYFVVMDGDLQHPSEQIVNMFVELEKGADLVVSCRLPYQEHQSALRKFITLISTLSARYVLRKRGFDIHDPMSGFFGGRTDFTKKIVMQYSQGFEHGGYKILFDILRVVPNDIIIKQSFYHFGLRPEGTSKLRPIHAFYFFRSLFRK